MHFRELTLQKFPHLNVRVAHLKMLLEALDGEETVVFTTVAGKHYDKLKKGS